MQKRIQQYINREPNMKIMKIKLLIVVIVLFFTAKNCHNRECSYIYGKRWSFRFEWFFLLTFSLVMKHLKVTKFHEKTKMCQNHEGSCYYFTFWAPKKLPFSSKEGYMEGVWGPGRSLDSIRISVSLSKVILLKKMLTKYLATLTR